MIRPRPVSFPTFLRASARWPTKILLATLAAGAAIAAQPSGALTEFKRDIQPLLKKYCYDCHGDGMSKGKVAFDELTDADVLAKHDLWSAALKNVRAGLMPPKEAGDDNARPTAAEVARLAEWIKFKALAINPAALDPGRAVVRRLNRVEYRNTIRDLMGVEFNSEAEFPADDSGGGFDNIGEVLTMSPLLLEKYLEAASTIVEKAIPRAARRMPEETATGREFRGDGGSGERLLITKAAKVTRAFRVEHAQTYALAAELEIRGTFDFDAGRGTVIARVDGAEWFREDVVWQEKKTLSHAREFAWTPGRHLVEFEIVPRVVPPDEPPPPVRRQSVAGATSVTVRVASVQVKGPLDPKFWKTPDNYARFFPSGETPPPPGAARDDYARDVLRRFATRAFRRPVDEAKLTQLVGLAREVYMQPGRAFEDGFAHAAMAVLASPRFLFRVEAPAAGAGVEAFPLADDYALASRLSYFLWSTMPDEELMQLAAKGALRRELKPQLARMLADARAQAFVKNFTGQWLQARDVESIPINVRAVFGSNPPSVLRNRDGRTDLDGQWRRLLRSETEMAFDYVLREDRSVLELIDADYAFLNEKLASLYGVEGVTGEELHRVTLPAGSVRGGVLTQGTVLVVTSNPTRTSPVKRGLFILDNILGTPPPPPPGDVPALEEARKEFKGREPKLSEMLAIHRADKLCSSCHQRMDPLG
ncbi:MAG: hypothetical protein RLZZ15_1130, partial [Verrucomicrobiota bacterium]